MPDGRRDSSAGAGLDRRAHPRCVERPGPGGGHHRPAHCYRERPRPECCCARRSHRHQWIRVGHWDACRGPARQDPGPRRRLALIHVATTRARRGCGPAAARSPRLCTSAPDRPSDRALGTASGQHSGQPRSEQRARPERPAVAGRGQHVSGCLGEPRQPRDRGRDCPRNGVAGRRRASDRDVGHWGHKSRRASRGDWPTRRPARPVGRRPRTMRPRPVPLLVPSGVRRRIVGCPGDLIVRVRDAGTARRLGVVRTSYPLHGCYLAEVVRPSFVGLGPGSAPGPIGRPAHAAASAT